MEYRSIGRPNLCISRLWLASTLSSSNNLRTFQTRIVEDEASYIKMLDRYVEAGGNVIFTNNSDVMTQVAIGKWLSKQDPDTRSKLIIIISFLPPGRLNQHVTNFESFINAVEDSIQKMKASYLDVYVIEHCDPATELEKIVGALQKLTERKLIRHYGVSNYSLVELEKIISMCECHHWTLPIFVQNQYNVICSNLEPKLISFCYSYNIGLIVYPSDSIGWIYNSYTEKDAFQLVKFTAGRMTFQQTDHGDDSNTLMLETNPKTWQILRKCASIADDLKSTIAQVIIRWICGQNVSGCRVSPSTILELNDCLMVFRLKFTTMHAKILDETNLLLPAQVPSLGSELDIEYFSNIGKIEHNQSSINNLSIRIVSNIDEKIFNLVTNGNLRYLEMSSILDSQNRRKKTLDPANLVLVFGGFISYTESITTFRQLFLKLGMDETIQSFISDALDIVNDLLLYVKKELNITWMDSNLNLFEWIRSGTFDEDGNDRPRFAVCLSVFLINQIALFFHFLHLTNIKLVELKKSCIFLSGLSLGTVTAYLINISNDEQCLYHNSLIAIRLVFWLGFRASQDFQEAKVAQYALYLNKPHSNLLPSDSTSIASLVTYKTGSIQVSGVHHQDVFNALDNFNRTNPIGCTFDISVVSQCDRVTIGGFVCYLPYLIEYLQLTFPTCLMVSVALDVPTHIARYFRNTVSVVIQDFTKGPCDFIDGSFNSKVRQLNLVSSSTGKLVEAMDYVELVRSLLIEICRWDLVSDNFAELMKSTISKTSESSKPIIIIDFGPGMPSKCFINHNRQMQQWSTERKISSCMVNSLPYSLMATAQKVNERSFNDNVFNDNDEQNTKHTIAIIGTACQLPGVGDADEFFYNLVYGRDSTEVDPSISTNLVEILKQRPHSSDQNNTKNIELMPEAGSYHSRMSNLNLHDTSGMDPHLCLVLDTCYSALENAGYVMSEGVRIGMDEQRTGVFLGCTNANSHHHDKEVNIDIHMEKNRSRSISATDISGFFKFCGPSIQIDTNHSTCFLCLHLAVESLRRGECDTALVCTILSRIDRSYDCELSPGSKASDEKLAGTRDFSADFRKFRNENEIVVIILKPFQRAIRSRDFIHGLIDSTVIYQLNHPKNLLLTSQEQVESLIYSALLKARITPGTIQYSTVESPGTQETDTIVINAIIKMMATDMYRSERNPLFLSLQKALLPKYRIASSLIGLIRTVLMLKNRIILPQVEKGYNKQNSPTDKRHNVIIPQEPGPWVIPSGNITRRAIVNSYDINGLHAVCILREAPNLTEGLHQMNIEPLHLIVLSGNEADSVRAYVLRFVQYLMSIEQKLSGDSTALNPLSPQAEQQFLRDLSYTSTVRRHHFTHRIAVLSSSLKELIEKLSSLLLLEPEQRHNSQPNFRSQLTEPSNLSTQRIFLSNSLKEPIGHIQTKSDLIESRLVFVFGGHEIEHLHAFKQMLKYDNMCTNTFSLCSELFSKIHPTIFPENLTLQELLECNHVKEADLFDGKNDEISHERSSISTELYQPLIFSIQYSLARTLISWGLSPNYIIGHSLGDIVAACISAAISLEDALFLIGHRARLMASSSTGAMLAIDCTINDFTILCQTLHLNECSHTEVSIAAYNGTHSIVVAGGTSSIDRLQSYLMNTSLFRFKRFHTTHAVHTHSIASILSEFRTFTNKIIYRRSEIPVLNTVQGQTRVNFHANYFIEQLSNPMQFHTAISSVCNIGIKKGFRPVLLTFNFSSNSVQCLTDLKKELTPFLLMSDNRTYFEQIYSIVGKLYVDHSVSVQWSELHRTNHYPMVVPLPYYPLNHSPCSIELGRPEKATENDKSGHDQSNCIQKLNFEQVLKEDFKEIEHELSLIGKCRINYYPLQENFVCSFPILRPDWNKNGLNNSISFKNSSMISWTAAYASQFAFFILTQTNVDSVLTSSAVIKNLILKKPLLAHDDDGALIETLHEMNICLGYSKITFEQETNAKMLNFTVSSRKIHEDQKNSISELNIHMSGTFYMNDADSENSFACKAAFDRIKIAFNDSISQSSSCVSYKTIELTEPMKGQKTSYWSYRGFIERLVINCETFIMWSELAMPVEQCHLDSSALIIIQPTWLDIFIQTIFIQASLALSLDEPFVITSVNNLTCRTHANINAILRMNEDRIRISDMKPYPTSSILFTETRLRVQAQNRFNCDMSAFDTSGNCIIFIKDMIFTTANNEPSQIRSGLWEPFQEPTKTVDDGSIVKYTPSESNDHCGNTISNRNGVKKMIVEILRDVLEFDSTEIDWNENFSRMGIDESLSIKIYKNLQNNLKDIDLPSNILADYSSINALTLFIDSLKSQLPQMTQEALNQDGSNDQTSGSIIQNDHGPALRTLENESEKCKNSQCYQVNSLSQAQVRTMVVGLIAESLGTKPEKINDDDLLEHLGIDLLLFKEISRKLQVTFRLNLPECIFLDYPTLNHLIFFIQSQLRTPSSSE